MKKTSLCFIETAFEIGGGQIGLFDLLTYLDKNIFSLMVIHNYNYGPFYEALLKHTDIELHYIPFNRLPWCFREREFLPLYDCRGQRLLIKKLSLLKPDIIHSNHLLAAKYGAVAAKKLLIPNIVTIRNVYIKKIFNSNFFVDRRLQKNADYIISNSYAGMKAFIHRIPAHQLRVIRNGVNISRFSRTHKDRGSQVYTHDKALFLIPAKIIPIKGHAVLIKAIPHIVNKYPQSHFLFVGSENTDSGYKRYLQHLCTQLSIEHYTSWIDFCTDIEHYYQKAYATILPSLTGEGLPRVIIESMASGKPVIGSDIEGINELIIDSKNGFLFKNKDSIDCARAIMKLLALNSANYSLLCSECTIYAEKNFSITHMIENYQNLYKSLKP